MEKIIGSCLCSSVRFERDDVIKHFHLCHCTQCQKATGSAHASNLFTEVNNITWLAGAELVKRYDVPGRSISNAFCGQCGSALPYASLSGKALVIPAGCLDNASSTQPQSHIFYAEKASWYEPALGSTKYNTLPSEE